MKNLKFLLLVCLCIFSSGLVFAQIEDPTTWSYEAKKKTGNEYDLIFHVKLKKDWHIWGMNPGGDGSLIPPSFKFDKNVNVKFKGKTKEIGKPIIDNIEEVGKVTFFEGQVDYIQTVVVSGKATLKGKLEYQVCNKSTCLPPKKKDFVFEVKK